MILFNLLLSAALLTGCGNLGTGVVIWPPEDGIWEPGDLVTVKDESILRNTYIVYLPDQNLLKKEIEKWRLHLHRKKKDAVLFSTNLGEWRQVYAECRYQGLPMRSETNNTSTQIYRFREGEMMKVLSRNSNPVQVGNLEGYWYRVVAEGGIEGYVFDYYLQVVEIVNGEKRTFNVRNMNDPVLNAILTENWRPEFYNNMIEKRQIDLTVFKPEYGFFPDAATKTLSLRLPRHSIDETWTEAVPIGRNRYDFIDTSFRITSNNEDLISVQYNEGSREYLETFVRFEGNIEEIIEKEKTRRKSIIAKLIEQGPRFNSNVYGEMAVFDAGRFTWIGKSSLISRGILSSGAGNSGVIELDYFVDPAISLAHEGVLGFMFDSGEAARFLYAFEDGALRLLHVPYNAIKDKIVRFDQYSNSVRLLFFPLSPIKLKSDDDIPDR